MANRFKVRFNKFREWVNLGIYDVKPKFLRQLRLISVPLSILAVVSLLAYHGFQLADWQQDWVGIILQVTIGFYIFKYLADIFFSFEPWQFIKDTRWEALLMAYMIVNIVSINVFDFEIISKLGQTIGIKELDAVFMVLVQIYFLLFVALEIGKATRLLPNLKLSPAAMLVISFLGFMIIGAGLLMMPEMSTAPGSMGFLDALFTSVSAVSVTGLNVIDVTEMLSFKGHLILMILIQIGGLNFITFASMLAMLANPSMSMRITSMFGSSSGSQGLANSTELLKLIIRFSLFFELVTAVFLFFSWGDFGFATLGDQIFFSLFHAVSAFNNAGFSLIPDGMANPLIAGNTLCHCHWRGHHFGRPWIHSHSRLVQHTGPCEPSQEPLDSYYCQYQNRSLRSGHFDPGRHAPLCPCRKWQQSRWHVLWRKIVDELFPVRHLAYRRFQYRRHWFDWPACLAHLHGLHVHWWIERFDSRRYQNFDLHLGIFECLGHHQRS